MEWTRKHQNLTSASVNSVSRSSVSKQKQDLLVRRKTGNASEGCNSERRLQLCREARKPRERSRRGLKKQARKHRSDSKLNGSEGPADVTLKKPNKRLAGCWITAKVMLAAMKMIQKHNNDADSDKSTDTTSNFVYRNDTSKDEQGLNAVRPLFTIYSHQRI